MPNLKHLKTVLFISAMLLFYSAKSENYYLSNTGNDSNSGTSASYPWKTLEKLNSFKHFKPGDNILFKRGNTFYGSIKIVKTYGDPVNFGTPGNPIIFSAYSTGAKPIITGLTTVAGWVKKGHNIWESTNQVSTLPTVSVVKVDEVNTPMGRFPNVGWRTIQSATYTSITDKTLGPTNWTGAELVTKKEKYIIDRDPVTSQLGGTLNFSTASGYSPRKYWGYFIQNDLRTLDSPNEWYYDSTTKKLFIYSATTPGEVKVSSSKTLITLIGYSMGGCVHINNLAFEGANESAIYIGAFGHLNIQNCDFNFSYAGIVGWNYSQASDSIIVDNCTFSDMQDIAILFPDEFTHATLTNNSIENVGILVGMSGSGDYKACGMRVQGGHSLVQYNNIKNVGYHGIIFNGEGVLIKNNFIENALAVKDDGGGIYTYEDHYPGKVIESNIVINCHGNDGGVPASYLPNMTNAEGIYLDGWSSNLMVINNTVANIRKSGIMVNLGDNITIRGNTIFNCFRQGMDIRDVINYTSNKSTGLNVKDNIIVQKHKPSADYFGSTYFNQLMLHLVSASDDFANWGVIDSNYYGRPIDDSVVFNIQPDNSTWTKGKYLPENLAGWQDYKGDDLNSHTAPVSIANTSDVILKYNATKLPVVENIHGTWIDMRGELYTGKVALQPYTSVILLKWDFKVPVANAGSDKTITLPENAVTLKGSGSDADRKVVSYLWTKISGPASFNIVNPSSAVTNVTGLVEGVYVFELKVTDNKRGVGKDTVKITVKAAANIPPVAKAGENRIITLPINAVTLRGSGSDVDGKIVSWLWTKLSGPASFNIVNPASPVTDASGLVAGVYRFELKVTDNDRGVGKDTVQVTVIAKTNIPPVANAGSDKTIILPLNTITLRGSGSDVDGKIVSWLWVKLSGPASFNIVNPASPVTDASGLVVGVYRFELKVTDNNGGVGKDTVQVNVIAKANIPPVANAGSDRTITLPVNSVTLAGSGNDVDGKIVSWLWTKIAGPASFNIVNPASPLTDVRGLVTGVYLFELKVRNDRGGIGKDTVRVTVHAGANVPPVANAGPDMTIILPGNKVILNGSGSDADGTIVSYLWRQISGPNDCSIQSAKSASTNITDLVGGTYRFELTVTDNMSAIGRDTMTLTAALSRLSPESDILKFYPNTVNDIGVLEINSKFTDQNMLIVLSDSEGKVMMRKHLNVSESTIHERIYMANFARGVYFLTVYFAEINKQSLKIMKL